MAVFIFPIILFALMIFFLGVWIGIGIQKDKQIDEANRPEDYELGRRDEFKKWKFAAENNEFLEVGDTTFCVDIINDGDN